MPRSQTSSTHWIRPSVSASTIAEVFPLPLRGTDQLFYPMPFLYVYPSTLNVPLLVESLRTTLGRYLHVCGTLERHPELGWSIGWHTRGVPLTIAYSEHVQHDHYAIHETPPAELIDSVVSGPGTEGSPLLKIKITFSGKSGETFIGVSNCHSAGDMSFTDAFMRTWSSLYQGQRLDPSTAPTWEKYKTAPADRHHDTNFVRHEMSNLSALYPLSELEAMSSRAAAETEGVNITFSGSQLKQLGEVASSRDGQRVSKQDALSAYLVTILNRCDPEHPMTRVSTLISYRGVQSPNDPSAWQTPGANSMGTACVQIYTPNLDAHERHSIRAVASKIRECVSKGRDYEYVQRAVGNMNPIYSRPLEDGMGHRLAQDSVFALNSTIRIPLHEAHFGFPDRTRAMTFTSFAGLCRFFAASPIKRGDGANSTWSVDRDAIVVMMRLTPLVKSQFLAVLAGDLGSPSFPRNLRRREDEITMGGHIMSHL